MVRTQCFGLIIGYPWVLYTFDDRIIYDSGMQRHAKVLAIIRDEGWAWPVANSPYLLTLKNSIPNSLCPFPNQANSVIWTPASGVFTTSSAWHTLRLSRPRVDWCRLVWFSGMVPKTSFFLWLAVRERLGTQDRLRHPIPDILCLLCSVVQENHDHLSLDAPLLFKYGPQCVIMEDS